MQTRFLSALCASVALFVLSQSSPAAIYYSFDQDAYSVAPGGGLYVHAYLSFTGADLGWLPTPPRNTPPRGLASAGMKLTRSAAPPISPARLTAVAGNPPSSTTS